MARQYQPLFDALFGRSVAGGAPVDPVDGGDGGSGGGSNKAEWVYNAYAAFVTGKYMSLQAKAQVNVFKNPHGIFVAPVVSMSSFSPANKNTNTNTGAAVKPGQHSSTDVTDTVNVSFRLDYDWDITVSLLVPNPPGLPQNSTPPVPVQMNYSISGGLTMQIDVPNVPLHYGCALLLVNGSVL
jgi:hypothetical protein